MVIKMKATEWIPALSTGALDTASLEAMYSAGLRAIEISTKPELYPQIDWKRLTGDSDRVGIKLWSLHLPFYGPRRVDISTTDSDMRAYSLELMREYIAKSGDAGIRICVIHPSTEPNPLGEGRDELIDISSESLASLADYAAKYGVTIAVEELPRTCLGNNSSELLRLISKNDKLRVCFDTNHLLGEDHRSFIKAVGKKIITLHVSDYDFLNERHWLPGEGKIDWVGVVDSLESVGYDGVLLYELGLTPPNTIDRRELTYADFYNNYLSLVNKRPPEVFGKPIDEVCLKNAYIQPK